MPVLSLNQVRQRLARGEFPRYLLLQGEERFLAREVLGELRRGMEQHWSLIDYVEWEDTLTREELNQMLVTTPPGGGRRLVVLHNPGAGVLKDSLKIAGPAVVLVLLCEQKLTRNTRAARFLAEHGWVVDCSTLRGRDLNRWLVVEGHALKREVTPAAQEYLRFLCGDNLALLHQELVKASLYLGKEPGAITPGLLREVGSRTAHRSIFELVDAVAERKRDAVRDALLETAAQGQPPALVVALLSRHFLLMLEMACYLEEGVTPSRLPEVMGLRPFMVRKLQQQLGAFPVVELDRILAVLLELDADLKQGRGNPQLLLEATLMELCTKKPPALGGKR